MSTDKHTLDVLYHMLRVVRTNTGLDSTELEAVAGISSHILSKQGDYTGLMRFLNYYGTRFTAPEATEIIRSNKFRLDEFEKENIDRIVDIGSGSGWLSIFMANNLELKNLRIDKRQWTGIDIVADVETTNGIKRVLDVLTPHDLIIMSEFLHCVEKPVQIVEQFERWPILIIEYMPTVEAWEDSYTKQIKLMGAEAMTMRRIGNIIDGRKVFYDGHTDTHYFLLLDRKQVG